MPIYLKQSTASQEVPIGPMLDSTDGNTQETGLTIANTDIKLWVAGATTLADKNSGGATHIANGVYYAVLDATDTATLGSLVIFCHPSGALAVRVECVVLAANVYDSLIGGGDTLNADVTQWNGTNVASPATAGYPAVTLKVGTGTGEVNLSSGAVPVTGDLTATMKSSVNNEVLDVFNVDTFAQPGQENPAATTTLSLMLRYLYKAFRNRNTQTSSQYSLYADDATTVDQKSTVSDNGTTFDRGELATGP